MTKGILYIAIGDKYKEEAVRNITRTREVWPEIPVTYREVDYSQPVMNQRIKALMEYHYDQTLYLDTDTYLVEPVPELFEVLDNFDIALAHAPWRVAYPIDDVPDCFPEFNCGVMAFNWSEAIKTIFSAWTWAFAEDYETRKDEQVVGWFPSQPTFRKLLYRSNLRIATLTSEYNWRGIGYAHGKVKILHVRQNPDEVNQKINYSTEPRISR